MNPVTRKDKMNVRSVGGKAAQGSVGLRPLHAKGAMADGILTYSLVPSDQELL